MSMFIQSRDCPMYCVVRVDSVVVIDREEEEGHGDRPKIRYCMKTILIMTTMINMIMRMIQSLSETIFGIGTTIVCYWSLVCPTQIWSTLNFTIAFLWCPIVSCWIIPLNPSLFLYGGTLSLEDLVTDVMMDPVAVEALGVEFGFDATDQYCHAGPSRFAMAWIARHVAPSRLSTIAIAVGRSLFGCGDVYLVGIHVATTVFEFARLQLFSSRLYHDMGIGDTL